MDKGEQTEAGLSGENLKAILDLQNTSDSIDEYLEIGDVDSAPTEELFESVLQTLLNLEKRLDYCDKEKINSLTQTDLENLQKLFLFSKNFIIPNLLKKEKEGKLPEKYKKSVEKIRLNFIDLIERFNRYYLPAFGPKEK